MFKGRDDRDSLRDATYSEIQGFPENAGQQQITDIVKHLKKAYSTSTVNMMSQDYSSSPKSALQALSHIATTTQNQKVSQTVDHKLSPSQIIVNEGAIKPQKKRNILYQQPNFKIAQSLTIDVIEYE